MEIHLGYHKERTRSTSGFGVRSGVASGSPVSLCCLCPSLAGTWGGWAGREKGPSVPKRGKCCPLRTPRGHRASTKA